MRLCINYMIILIIISAPVHAATKQMLNISGAVKHPMCLGLNDLGSFKTIEVHLNEITKTGQFRGVFTFQGVSLKTLLKVADIQKKKTDFKKPVDLAILIRNAEGEQIALSWSEVFYRNPGDIIIAMSSNPVFPHKGPGHFKDPQKYKNMMQTLKRKINFPKLIVAKDLFSDRCLENIVEIEVHDLHPDVPGKKSPHVYSDSFSIHGNVKNAITIGELPNYRKIQLTAHVVGEGRGYHGTNQYSGISFKRLIEGSKPKMDLNTVFLLSAPDAYRVLLSYGEVFLNPQGERIIIADKINNSAMENGGKFLLMLPDDLMADRELKAVSRIEVISLKKNPCPLGP